MSKQDVTRGAGDELHQQPPGRRTALTTNQGLRDLRQPELAAAHPAGPTLLEDFVLREKITHFDHERIPERIVHARGSRRARLLRTDRLARAVHDRRGC